MSGNGVSGRCPACFTSIGWVDLSHEGILHGRSAAAGGPYFTIHCPGCQEPLRAEGGVGRVYRFSSVRSAPVGASSWWGRWFRLLFGAPTLNESRSPRSSRARPPPAGGAGGRPGREAAGASRPAVGEALLRRLRELDLGAEATLDDVKRRFRQLAKQTHPDALSTASADVREASRRRFIEINRAYREIVQRWPKGSHDRGEAR
ncbi:MAG: DnaJ family molecular chaperone [Planctomycetota bacterium JB042]